jgi:hypothetical protein
MSTVWQSTVSGSGSRQKPGQTSTGTSEIGEVCIANISPRERRKRLMAGVIQFAAGLAILAALIVTGVDRLWRLPLFLVFWGAAAGYFQWRDKT